MAKEVTKKRKRAEIPENETKLQRFVRVGEPRVTKALKALDAVAGLTNPSQYEFTKEAAGQITAALEQRLQRVKDRFANPSRAKATDQFKIG